MCILSGCDYLPSVPGIGLTTAHKMMKKYSKNVNNVSMYHIAGKFGEFDKSSLICQTKTIQISTYNYNLWQNLFIRQTFFRQMLKMNIFAKLSPHKTFPLYGINRNTTEM